MVEGGARGLSVGRGAGVRTFFDAQHSQRHAKLGEVGGEVLVEEFFDGLERDAVLRALGRVERRLDGVAALCDELGDRRVRERVAELELRLILELLPASKRFEQWCALRARHTCTSRL